MTSSWSRLVSNLIIAVALVAAAVVLAKGWKQTHVSYQSVSVTGHGQKDFRSDLIVWNAVFSRQAFNLAEANARIREDITEVKRFLQAHGIPENEVSFSTVKVNREYGTRYNNEGNMVGSEFKGFMLAQEITVKSKQLEKVEKLTAEISDLIEKGIELSAQEPDYFYTRLQDLKIELLKQATKDALERAETITGNANSRTGKLRNASMGVFQITGQNSNENYSWGGSFNTKAKDKTASITVKLEFDL